VSPGSATLADYLSGMYGALGALVALQARDKTQEGQVVDVGLYESVFRILDELAPAYHFNGYIRERMGAGTVNVVPHSHYQTKDKKWIAIACTNDKIFMRLAVLMGCPELAGNGKWGKIIDREKDRLAIDQFVTDWTTQFTRQELLKLCSSGEVPCGPINSIEEIFTNEQFAARENIAFIKEPRISEDQVIAVPNVVPRLSATPGKIHSLGPKLGADVDSLLASILALKPEEIENLRQEGVI
jgi:crotonobetainyl-CoA:carnitine CoA-transferase CaiB-like acyl-CoA transferase